MNDSLRGLQVLVTRPAERGMDLCADINSAGGDATHLPVIAFAPPSNEQAFQTALHQISNQDWLIFVSAQAARVLLAYLKVHPLTKKTKLAAVGETTAGILQSEGYAVIYPEEEWNSEGLLSLDVFQDVKNKKIMIIKGEGGREHLAHILVERGALVSDCIAYRRIMSDINIESYQMMLKQNFFHVAVCTSFESIQNLLVLLGSQVLDLPLLVVSERIKRLAHNLGFQTIWLAKNASNEAILATLKQIRNEL